MAYVVASSSFQMAVLNDDLDNHLIIWGQGIKFGKGGDLVFSGNFLSDNGIPHVKSVKCGGIACCALNYEGKLTCWGHWQAVYQPLDEVIEMMSVNSILTIIPFAG